jgi:hypothetical protein
LTTSLWLLPTWQVELFNESILSPLGFPPAPTDVPHTLLSLMLHVALPLAEILSAVEMLLHLAYQVGWMDGRAFVINASPSLDHSKSAVNFQN